MEKSDNTRQVSVPCAAWDGDNIMHLHFPDDWDVIVNRITDAPPIGEAAIDAAVRRPIGTSPLRDIAAGKQRVVIAVEDISRPTPCEPILTSVLSELNAAGVSPDKILILICNGAHAPMTRVDMVCKLGQDIADHYPVLNHNPYDNLSETGVVLGKTPLKLNRFFMEADLRIAAGSIIAHPFAGFSAGAKLLIPGLADIASLERTHKYVMMGFRGGVNDAETNQFRKEIEDAVAAVGLHFFIGAVPNSKRQIAGVFAGHMIGAHREGVAFARQIFGTAISSPCDVAVLNAYPKDAELIQADTALLPLKTIRPESFIHENGVIIIISRCARGFGHHSLFGPGMRLWKKPIRRRFLKDRELIVLAPGVPQAAFHWLYWEGYKLVSTWDDALTLVKTHFSSPPKVSVLPCAPLQLLKDKG